MFENEISDKHSIQALHKCLVRDNACSLSTTKIDITGNRVRIYILLVDIASTIRFTITPLLTGYNISTKKYKTWKNQPPQYCSEKRRSITNHLHADVDNLRSYKHFQQAVVE